MADSLRDVWKKAKDKYKKDLDMTKVADKQNFGSRLDKFAEKVKAYEVLEEKLKMKPDSAKSKAAKDAVKKAATEALTALAVYAKDLKYFEATCVGAGKTAAAALLNVLLFDISRTLTDATEGRI
ncbi:hypothetical protein [Variovorax sp. LjRoot178]|uniref:hypothetical protein n=1 Tax=Variovorax sp. LjRoot178 TaxID=3342277 RepID=UPI003ECE0D36